MTTNQPTNQPKERDLARLFLFLVVQQEHTTEKISLSCAKQQRKKSFALRDKLFFFSSSSSLDDEQVSESVFN